MFRKPKGRADDKLGIPQGTLYLLILTIVRREPMHGYGIAQRLQLLTDGAFQINPGSLFPALYALERDGMLRCEERPEREQSQGALLRAHGARPQAARAGRATLGARDQRHRQRAAQRMTVLLPLRAFVRWLLRRDEIEQALDSDLADYVARSTEAKIRDGMSPAEARRAALIELGGVEQTKTRVRETLSFQPLDALLRDTRYALRTMRKQKTFTALAVLCLALGIGANTTIFSFMDSILFRALPVEKPDELVILQWTANRPDAKACRGQCRAAAAWSPSISRLRSDSWPYPVFELFREQRELFTEVFGSQPVSQLRVDDGDGPAADGLYVTRQFLPQSRRRRSGGTAARGRRRPFRRAARRRALVGFSAERFGSAEAAVGQTIRLNGVAFTVVGVAPPAFFGLDPERRPSFYLPMRSGPLLVAASPRLALPGGPSRFAAALVGNTLADVSGRRASTGFRLGRGCGPASAASRSKRRCARSSSSSSRPTSATRTSLRNTPRLEVAAGTGGLDGMRRNYGETLFVLFAMVVVILDVACASIASLLLERATARRSEMAVRMSLGAGRLSVIRQLLTESLLLALIGGAAGVVLSTRGHARPGGAPCHRDRRRAVPRGAQLAGLGAYARRDASDRRAVRARARPFMQRESPSSPR